MQSPPSSDKPSGQADMPDGTVPLAKVDPTEGSFTVGTLRYTKRALLTVCGWLLAADIGLAFRARALGPMIQLLLKGMGASNTLIASTHTIGSALSLIFNPIVASYSDRTRTRWGRRLPFIFVTVPILTVTMAMMGFSPQLGRLLHASLGAWSPGEKASGLIAFIAIFIVYDLAAIVQGRTWGGLINDIVPHKVLGRFAAAARIISLSAGIIFNQFLLAHVGTYQLTAFIVLSAIYGSTMIVLALFIREGEYPPPPPRPPSRGVMHAWYATLAFIKDCYGNPYYRWVMIMLCIDDIAFNAVNQFSLLHAQSLKMNLQTYGTCLSIQYLIALPLAYPIGMLADKFHPFRVSAVFLFMYGIAAVWSGFYIHNTTTFVIGFMLHGIFATSYNTAAATMGNRLLARSRFLILAAGQGIVGTVVGMIVTPLLGVLLDFTSTQAPDGTIVSEYRYTYLVGAGYVVLGVPLYFIVYRKFKALGGPDHYVAPDEVEITPEVRGFEVLPAKKSDGAS
jgi:MFS family permease